MEKSLAQKEFHINIPFLNKVSNKELVFFTRELSIMLSANVPLVQALDGIRKQMKKGRFRDVVGEISEDVESGTTFSDSLNQYPDIFNNVFVSMVKIGEASGTMDQSLSFIAEQVEKDYELRRKIKGAMIYPAFVLTAMFGVLAILFTFVIPKMIQMLTDTGAELPLTTKILIVTTNIATGYWWLFTLLIVGGIVGFQYMNSRPDGKLWWDDNKLKIPIVGNLLKKVYLERFARNFATLIQGGVPIVEALHTSADAIGNTAYREAILDVAEGVEAGRSVSQALGDHSDKIPSLIVQMVDIGEQTSKIDEILFKVATFYERESQQAVDVLTKILEPLIMLMLGGVVAIIVAGILLPIYNLVSAQ